MKIYKAILNGNPKGGYRPWEDVYFPTKKMATQFLKTGNVAFLLEIRIGRFTAQELCNRLNGMSDPNPDIEKVVISHRTLYDHTIHKGKTLPKTGGKPKGQGMTEYMLILLLIALVVVLAMTVLAPWIGNVFSEVGGTLSV